MFSAAEGDTHRVVKEFQTVACGLIMARILFGNEIREVNLERYLSITFYKFYTTVLYE